MTPPPILYRENVMKNIQYEGPSERIGTVAGYFARGETKAVDDEIAAELLAETEHEFVEAAADAVKPARKDK